MFVVIVEVAAKILYFSLRQTTIFLGRLVWFVRLGEPSEFIYENHFDKICRSRRCSLIQFDESQRIGFIKNGKLKFSHTFCIYTPNMWFIILWTYTISVIYEIPIIGPSKRGQIRDQRWAAPDMP